MIVTPEVTGLAVDSAPERERYLVSRRLEARGSIDQLLLIWIRSEEWSKGESELPYEYLNEISDGSIGEKSIMPDIVRPDSNLVYEWECTEAKLRN